MDFEKLRKSGATTITVDDHLPTLRQRHARSGERHALAAHGNPRVAGLMVRQWGRTPSILRSVAGALRGAQWWGTAAEGPSIGQGTLSASHPSWGRHTDQDSPNSRGGSR